MCDQLKTHTDGHRGLCKSHAYRVKQAGGHVALELEPEPEPEPTGKGKAVAQVPPKICEWVDPEPDPVADPEPDEDSQEQPTEE